MADIKLKNGLPDISENRGMREFKLWPLTDRAKEDLVNIIVATLVY